jgi:HSP20 family protein
MLSARIWRDPFFPSVGVLDDLLGRSLWLAGNGAQTWSPPVDVRESEEHYHVLVDLPGVDPDAVTVEVEDGVLTIAGERPQLEGGVFRLERPYGRFRRSLRLPEGCDVDQVVADFRNGVLELRVPKPAERRPKKIAIAGGGKKELHETAA